MLRSEKYKVSAKLLLRGEERIGEVTGYLHLYHLPLPNAECEIVPGDKNSPELLVTGPVSEGMA